jgi:hypothetical protein
MRSPTTWLLISSFCILPSLAWAQLNAVRATAPVVVNTAPSYSPQAELDVRTDSYFNPNYHSTTDRNFDFIGGKIVYMDPHQDMGLKAQVSGMYSPEDPTLSYLNVRQLYFQGWGLSIGRKLNDWSILDEQWHLGFFQPQFQWNPLLPESQGLTGLFIDLNDGDKKSPLGVRLFSSIIYIPNQNAGYQIQNGQFQSVNPWFQQMPTQIQFQGANSVTNTIDWNIQTPDTSQVVFNPSYMAQFYYGREDQGFYFATSAGYKPSNQLLMAVSTATTPGTTTNITVDPVVYYHTVESMDMRYKPNAFYGGVGFMNETPSAPESMPAADLNYRIYNARQLLSPYLGVKAFGFDGSVSYLSIQGNSDMVQGNQAQYLSNYLPQQIGYGNAVRTDLSYVFGRHFLPGLKLTSSYMQGVNDDFELWSMAANYRLTRHWAVNGSLMMVEADPTSTTASLFQQFQNNNLVSMGASYGF